MWTTFILIQLFLRLKIHLVFHMSLLKACLGDTGDPSRDQSRCMPIVVVIAFNKDVECIIVDYEIRRRGIKRVLSKVERHPLQQSQLRMERRSIVIHRAHSNV